MGARVYALLLLCCLKWTFTGGSAEQASGGLWDGHCGRLLRAQTQGTRRNGHHEFRLRIDGDPETYEPGSTYRGRGSLRQISNFHPFHLQIKCFSFVCDLILLFLLGGNGQTSPGRTEEAGL